MRASCIRVYNAIEEEGYINSHNLAKKLNIPHRRARECIAKLRDMFKNGEVDKNVCVSKSNLGYFLSDKEEDMAFSHAERIAKAVQMLKDVEEEKEACQKRKNERLSI